MNHHWGHVACGLVFRYDYNVHSDCILIKLHNGQLYYCQSLHRTTSVECLGHNCNVQYTNANQGIMPESQHICVEYAECEDNHFDDTFQGQVLSFPVLYFSWNQLNQIEQFEDCLPTGKMKLIFSKRSMYTEQLVLYPPVGECVVVIPTLYHDPLGWVDCTVGFMQVVTQTN